MPRTAAQKAWYAGHRSETATYLKEWRAAHGEEMAAQRRRYRAVHGSEIQARQATYRAAHPDKIARKNAAAYTERRLAIDAIKLERGCIDCGYREHPQALHFDHLPGTVKRFNISSQVKAPWPKLLAEIAKCEVVCANCHAVRTATRRKSK